MITFATWPWHHWAQQTPHSIALRVDDVDWSWRSLASRIDQLAAAWQRAGVTVGSGVALRGKNSLELLLAYLAALQCGARALPLNPHLPAELLAERLPTLNIEFGWCARDVSWPGAITPLSVADISSAAAAIPPWQVNRLATLTLTSGSSGLPKAAAHTFAAHLASARGVIRLMDFQRRHGWLLSLPLYHVSGQGIVWRWLAVGATLALAQDLRLEQALAGCTHASLVPTQLWRLLQGDPERLSLRDVLLGGAMIPLELTQRAEALGVRCWCGYGLTEFASTVCAKRADASSGVGLPLAGREVRLVDGEVWLRGGGMASGYWQQGRLVPLADGDGWFHTRDGGRFVDGELHINGRLDNVFFCGGEGVQPEDIERILAKHPAVRQSYVVPVEDEEFGQRPVAVLEADASFTELRAWLEPQLAPWQRPVAYLSLFHVIPDLLTAGGIKIVRSQLTRLAQAQFASNP
ncbi:o-succinylbenzoate--CoA ligase [Acerihabitans arboris]|uniref:O-succinylbenzoate--CoA ligase n=1 Tax=Acerihabitans arboris TaxID=2691583 RepID=A0A845SRL4_9GAMM|nr:o-succinylbenzoate--CoA ligase [Acerihabitans arboris]NDL65268.1 o-succinylbenzoate--CoA ligase [Acerihabitans arboris]